MRWFTKKRSKAVPDHMDETELIYEAKLSDDPVYAYACLTKAETLDPDNLSVQRALLMLGRLHERGRDPADYSAIKSYVLHSFEHPEKYSEEGLKSAAEKMFRDPRLMRCLALAPDPQVFLEQYLDDLAEEYMRVFIAGDSSHAPRVFGFSARLKMSTYLARPVSDLISNALQSPFLTEDQRRMTARAVYKAFSRQMGGEIKALDQLLGAEICRVIA